MKLVISATGPTMNADVDPRFGRASFFLFIDGESGQLIESIDNSKLKNASQGAGIAAAAMVADKGAKYILTGVVGPKAMPIVDKAGMTVISDCKGTAQDAYKLFINRNSDSVSPQTTTPNESKPEESGCRRKGGMGRGLGKGGGKGQGGRGQGRCQQN